MQIRLQQLFPKPSSNISTHSAAVQTAPNACTHNFVPYISISTSEHTIAVQTSDHDVQSQSASSHHDLLYVRGHSVKFKAKKSLQRTIAMTTHPLRPKIQNSGKEPPGNARGSRRTEKPLHGSSIYPIVTSNVNHSSTTKEPVMKKKKSTSASFMYNTNMQNGNQSGNVGFPHRSARTTGTQTEPTYCTTHPPPVADRTVLSNGVPPSLPMHSRGAQTSIFNWQLIFDTCRGTRDAEEHSHSYTHHHIDGNTLNVDDLPHSSTPYPIAGNTRNADDLPHSSTHPYIAGNTRNANELRHSSAHHHTVENTWNVDDLPHSSSPHHIAGNTRNSNDLPHSSTHPPIAGNIRNSNDLPHSSTHPHISGNTRNSNDLPHSSTHPHIAGNTRNSNDLPHSSTHPNIAGNTRNSNELPHSSTHPHISGNTRNSNELPLSSAHHHTAGNTWNVDDLPHSSSPHHIAGNTRNADELPHSSTHHQIARNVRNANELPRSSTHPYIPGNTRNSNELPHSSLRHTTEFDHGIFYRSVQEASTSSRSQNPTYTPPSPYRENPYDDHVYGDVSRVPSATNLYSPPSPYRGDDYGFSDNSWPSFNIPSPKYSYTPPSPYQHPKRTSGVQTDLNGLVTDNRIKWDSQRPAITRRSNPAELPDYSSYDNTYEDSDSAIEGSFPIDSAEDSGDDKGRQSPKSYSAHYPQTAFTPQGSGKATALFTEDSHVDMSIQQSEAVQTELTSGLANRVQCEEQRPLLSVYLVVDPDNTSPNSGSPRYRNPPENSALPGTPVKQIPISTSAYLAATEIASRTKSRRDYPRAHYAELPPVKSKYHRYNHKTGKPHQKDSASLNTTGVKSLGRREMSTWESRLANTGSVNASNSNHGFECYICGHCYDAAYMARHEEQCLLRLERENSELPPSLRREVPDKPKRPPKKCGKST